MGARERYGQWAMVVGFGTALGAAIHCQTPASHVQVGMGEDCVTCHQSEFLSASQPLHVGVISEACAECHDNTAWSPARGTNHSWPLEGAHAAAACNSCHVGEPAVYVGTATACIGCHATDRDAVVSPSHADFSDECQSCHDVSAWKPASLEHEWPLEGAHSAAACGSCHTGDPPIYAGTPEQCIGCHEADRSAVTQPPHEPFSEDCSTCHTNAAWRPASFPAHEWPLEGAHALAECASCHTGAPPLYAGTPTACVSCHSADLASAAQPPHAGFSTECQSCHGTASWDGASFEHAVFALTGAHEAIACASCHTGMPAVFTGTPSECVGCHLEDYETSPFPGHSAFATTCQDCHSTAAWRPASGGNHPEQRFSLRGDHNFACNDCHDATLGPNGAGNANCVGCHEGEHTLAREDAEHDGVNGYPRGAGRAPNFCLQCHPGGNE